MTRAFVVGESDAPVVVGRIRGGFGVQGWLRVQTFTSPPENILGYTPWLVAPRDADRNSTASWQKMRVVDGRPHRDGFVVALDGVADRNTADELKGAWIGVAAHQLPELDSDEYYWRDLIGMSVVDAAGRCLGHIDRMLETGANDVMVIGGDTERLIPFHRTYVTAVDAPGKTVHVDWADD